MTRNLSNLNADWTTGLAALIIFLFVLGGLGLFAWWAFSWTTHTLVWFIFIFGSLLGSIKVAVK